MRRVLGWIGLALIALATPLKAGSTDAPLPAGPAAQTQPARYSAADFAEKSAMGSIRLSPDGSQTAYTLTEGGTVTLILMTTDDRKIDHRLQMPKKQELEWFRWAGNRRVLISLSQGGWIYDQEVLFTRLFVYDLDTRKMEPVRRGIAIDGDNVLYTDPKGEYVLLIVRRDIYAYPTVWRFPLSGTDEQKKGVVVQGAKAGVWGWAADTAGVVRLGFEQDGYGNVKIWYRSGPAQEFRIVGKVDASSADADFWKVVAVVGDSDEGYVLKSDASGNVAIRRFNYATQTAGETVLSVPGWDIDEALVDERTGALLGATYADDRDHVLWVEPVKKTQQARLAKALGGAETRIITWSDDNTRMVVWTGKEDDPGAFYTFNSKTGALDLLYAIKPKLDPAKLAKPRAVTYTARDGTPIPAILTLPPERDPKGLPLIILPHGGPFWVRDKLDFDTEAQFLASRGYAVLQPNYRGSGGYGEAFDRLGRGTIGRAMQDDLDDGMDWLVAQGIVDPTRVCMVGASYGGYAALWAVIRNPERYRCAASFAGVTDWKAQLRYDRNYFDRDATRDYRRRLTGEDEKFDLDLVSPAPQIARLKRPVLLAHGQDDWTVPFKQFKTMQSAAAKAKVPLDVLVFPDEGHGFTKAEDEAKWLETLEAFLAKHNPAD